MSGLSSKFSAGTVTEDHYYKQVVLPHVRLLRCVISADFFFINDHEWPHPILAVEELIESEDVTTMNWPAYYLDLNPME